MNTQPKTIFFIGKPGCGKGTQAKLLAEKTGWTVLGSGDQFRAIAKEDTPAGHKIKEEIEQGLLAPHWFAMYIYLKSLFGVSADTNVIFDGFNRKEAEARLIVDSMTWLNRPFVVLHIAVSDEEIRRRLEGRLQHAGRIDDNHVEKRLQEYETYTTRALEIFSNMDNLIEIDGGQAPDAVSRDIEAALGVA
jgi:adenylate kinase